MLVKTHSLNFLAILGSAWIIASPNAFSAPLTPQNGWDAFQAICLAGTAISGGRDGWQPVNPEQIPQPARPNAQFHITKSLVNHKINNGIATMWGTVTYRATNDRSYTLPLCSVIFLEKSQASIPKAQQWAGVPASTNLAGATDPHQTTYIFSPRPPHKQVNSDPDKAVFVDHAALEFTIYYDESRHLAAFSIIH